MNMDQPNTQQSEQSLVNKSKFLGFIIRVCISLLFIYWLAYVLQLISFLLFNVGGFVVSSLINLSSMAMWVPILAIILVIIVLIFWKKIPSPKWVIILGIYSFVTVFIPFGRIINLEYLIQVVGLILSVIAIHKVAQSYKASFGKISSANRFGVVVSVILIVFLNFIFAIGGAVMHAEQGIKQARNLQTIMRTPSNQLSTNDLATKNAELDRDLNIRMFNIRSDVFDLYYRDNHTYTNVCTDNKMKPYLNILRIDSQTQPVCRSNSTSAIVYVTNSKNIITCVDTVMKNPVDVTVEPTNLLCK